MRSLRCQICDIEIITTKEEEVAHKDYERIVCLHCHALAIPVKKKENNDETT